MNSTKTLERTLQLGALEIVDIQIRNDDMIVFPANGDCYPVNLAMLAEHLENPSLLEIGEDQTARIAAALAELPLYWRQEGDVLIARTVGGGHITRPAISTLTKFSSDGEVSALDQLNIATAVAGLGSVSVGQLAGGLGKGIAGKIGGEIGSMVIDAIFPPKSMQSYFDELYERIAKLVHEEIVENEISKINGILNGTQDFIRSTYLPRKEKRAPKQELLDMLKPWENDLYKINNILLESNFRQAGLSVFLVGAATHLSLFQEMALVDPLAKRPRDSSYATTLSKKKGEYIDSAQQTWKDVREAREALVKLEYDKNPQAPIPYNFRLEDNFTGEIIWRPEDYKDWIWNGGKQRKQYLEKVIGEFSQGLAGDDGIDALFDNWNAAYDALPTK